MDKVLDKFGHRGVHHGSVRETDSVDHQAGDERPTRSDFISTGRGGAGNILRSKSRDASQVSQAREAALERSVSRSRERQRERSESRMRIGRGGVGNFRSPSREPKTMEERQAEADAIEREMQKDAASFHASGRGGAGNMVRQPLNQAELQSMKDEASSQYRPSLDGEPNHPT